MHLGQALLYQLHASEVPLRREEFNTSFAKTSLTDNAAERHTSLRLYCSRWWAYMQRYVNVSPDNPYSLGNWHSVQYKSSSLPGPARECEPSMRETPGDWAAADLPCYTDLHRSRRSGGNSPGRAAAFYTEANISPVSDTAHQRSNVHSKITDDISLMLDTWLHATQVGGLARCSGRQAFHQPATARRSLGRSTCVGVWRGHRG